MQAWISQLIADWGYLGIAALMFAETVFPPIPSEAIMPLAGVAAAAGQMSPMGAVIAGTTGAMLGNVAWYAAARAIGPERLRPLIDAHGRWLTLRWSDVERGRRVFAHGGRLAVSLGRMVPTIRSLVSIPAGLLAMPFGRFALWSFVGTAAWTGALTIAGVAAGRSGGPVVQALDVVSTVVTVLAVVAYLWRLLMWKADAAR